MRLFDVLAILGLLAGLVVGGAAGGRFFGVFGAIIGALAGSYVGFVIGRLPDIISSELMFRQMQRRSNDQLRAMLDEPRWNFFQTLAFLNLFCRREDIQPYLPRVLSLLESEDLMSRFAARDALRWGFTPLAVDLDKLGYEPRSSALECREKLAKLKAGFTTG